MRELTYYVAVSVDGFIADPDGGYAAFPTEGDHFAGLAAAYPETFPGHVRPALGIDAPNRRFGTVVMGRRTYEPALAVGITSPYPHLDQHVVSRTLPDPEDPAITVVRDDPVAHVRALKEREGLGIWLCGGGLLAAALREEIDELVLKVNPVVLGDGRPLFDGPSDPRTLTLVERTGYDSGVTVLRYRC